MTKMDWKWPISKCNSHWPIITNCNQEIKKDQFILNDQLMTKNDQLKKMSNSKKMFNIDQKWPISKID